MNRRTFEGPMDWEYQNQGPVDLSSPFAKISRGQTTSPADKKPLPAASFNTPSKYGKQAPNPFATATSGRSPSKQQPQPPHSSLFNPQIQNKFSAPPFRNPAFTTPQKRVDELAYSECSGAESSPAMTDTSEMPPDTPDLDRPDDFAKMTITPSTANRALFHRKNSVGARAPGRGEVPRGKAEIQLRDRIRKRKRQLGDKDVGSVRHRVSHDSDGSDSDWEADATGSMRKGTAKGRKGSSSGPGWFGSFLMAIGNNPSVPAILSRWVQLAVNIVLVGGFLWFIYSGISMMRSDLANATEKARALVLAEMQACTHEYTKNRCAPKSERLPALDKVCEEWEACMNQDPSSVMKVQVSARNVAEIINEFVGVMSLKAWGFILSALLVAILANNIGFGKLRDASYSEPAKVANPFPSQAAAPPMLTSPQHDSHQAYIWAPIGQTPRRFRREIFAAEATDTDNSPEVKAIMPQTPSGRRSPSKGERGRSPTKGLRSPSKGY